MHIHISLQTAGNAVKRASETLVKSAQGSDAFGEQEITINVSSRFTAGMKQEIEAQEDILRKERELLEARRKLAAIRKGRYSREELDH